MKDKSPDGFTIIRKRSGGKYRYHLELPEQYRKKEYWGTARDLSKFDYIVFIIHGRKICLKAFLSGPSILMFHIRSYLRGLFYIPSSVLLPYEKGNLLEFVEDAGIVVRNLGGDFENIGRQVPEKSGVEKIPYLTIPKKVIDELGLEEKDNIRLERVEEKNNLPLVKLEAVGDDGTGRPLIERRVGVGKGKAKRNVITLFPKESEKCYFEGKPNLFVKGTGGVFMVVPSRDTIDYGVIAYSNGKGKKKNDRLMSVSSFVVNALGAKLGDWLSLDINRNLPLMKRERKITDEIGRKRLEGGNSVPIPSEIHRQVGGFFDGEDNKVNVTWSIIRE